jgi:hypothetical protein
LKEKIMRPLYWACAAVIIGTAAPLYAAELLPARLSIYLDPVYDGTGIVTAWTDIFESELPLSGDAFSGRFSGSLFGLDGEAGPSELSYEISLSGEVFPLLSLSKTIVGNGEPSSYLVVATLSVPALAVPATYDIDGSLTTTGRLQLLPGYSSFFGYSINGTFLSSQVPGPFGPGAVAFSTSGSLTCDLLGGCTLMSTMFGATGPGGGASITAMSNFDLNGVSEVPLPASLQLVLAGFGGLAVLARRRRT